MSSLVPDRRRDFFWCFRGRGALGLALSLALSLALTMAWGCAQPECVVPDYTDPECRVIVENERARLDAADGSELRFIDPHGQSALPWDALGLLQEPTPGAPIARVATLGDFALRIRRDPGEPGLVELHLDNVDPAAILSFGRPGATVDLPLAPRPLLRRELALELDPELATEGELELRGRLPCPDRFELAFVGDIQTNPTHFARILQRIAEDRDDAAADPERAPLLGLVVVGDLTEWSNDGEFTAIAGLLANASLPVAVTPGNHDIFRKAVAIYNTTFGPGTYAFEICGARVVVLDTGSAQLARSVEGRLGELLDRQGAEFLLAATHYPPSIGLAGDGWSSEEQAQILLAELALADADLIVAGHQHSLSDDRIQVGQRVLRQIIVGTGGADQGLGRARFGYLRVEVARGRGLRPCFVEVPPPGWPGPVHPPLPSLPHCNEF